MRSWKRYGDKDKERRSEKDSPRERDEALMVLMNIGGEGYDEEEEEKRGGGERWKERDWG